MNTGPRQTRDRRWSDAAGTVLIEVVVAIMLASILVVPLATGLTSAATRAEKVEEQSVRVVPSGIEEPGRAWEWGSSPSSVSWEAGPTLRVGTGSRDLPGLLVGIWADGWLLSEYVVGEEGVLAVGDAAWSEMRGQELVVRVRRSGCAWGPPRRTVVPDVYLQYEGELAGEGPAGESLAMLGEEVTVVHVPALATPEPVSSVLEAPLAEGGRGVPLFLAPSTPGLLDIILEEEAQTWLAEDGRALDIYF